MVSNLTDAELRALDTSRSGEEWSVAVKAVKAARDGEYPPDWYQRVLASGVAARAERRWDSGPTKCKHGIPRRHSCMLCLINGVHGTRG